VPKHQEQLVLVANPAHALAGSETLSLAQLARSRWVVFPVNMPMRLTLEREFREAGLSFPQYPIETSSTFTTLSMLLQDPGLLAVMPWDVAKVALDHGMLVRLPLQLKSRSEPYEVVTRKGVELSRPAQMLVSILMA
jgi:DNA-binding transcriptional LysR family regulator